MSPWEKLIDVPDPCSHLVQLYGVDPGVLTRNVSRYLAEGIRLGEGVVVIAEEQSITTFRESMEDLGVDVARVLRRRQLLFVDAHDALSRIVAHGQPYWEAFELVVMGAFREVRPVVLTNSVRAYGEMVNILWRSRQYTAATRLEQLWNRLLTRVTFSLYCAYDIDIFGDGFQSGMVDSIFGTHSHVIPCGSVEACITKALDEVVGEDAAALREFIRSHQQSAPTLMPPGEGLALWLRDNLPNEANAILDRARGHFLNAAAAAA